MHYAQSAGIDEAMEAAAAAGHAFRTWKRASISMRRSILQRVAAIFQREIDEFVRLQRLETSADEAWSRSNGETVDEKRGKKLTMNSQYHRLLPGRNCSASLGRGWDGINSAK